MELPRYKAQPFEKYALRSFEWASTQFSTRSDNQSRKINFLGNKKIIIFGLKLVFLMTFFSFLSLGSQFSTVAD